MSLLARIFVGAVVVVSVGACAFKKDDDKVTQDDVKELMRDVARREQKDSDAVVNSDELTVRVVPRKLPNRYALEISWPERLSNVQLLINDSPENNIVKGRATIEAFSGAEYKIELLSLSSLGRLVSHLVHTEVVPQDQIVASMKLDADWNTPKLGRLFFDRGAEIVLNGFNVNIQAEEIIANETTFKTVPSWDAEKSRPVLMPVNKRVLPVPEGANGEEYRQSNIHISAGRLKGDLKIWMFGLNGAHGRAWDELLPTGTPVRGEKGPQGESGAYEMRSICMGGSSLNCSKTNFPACTQRPGPGGQGGKGPTYHGEDGKDGGGTGNLTLQLHEQLEGNVTVFIRAGKGGDGGKGSPGLPGGEGGEPGNCPPGCSHCTTAKGPAGPSGEPGADGKKGADGLRGVILFMNAEVTSSPNFRVFDASEM